MSVCLLLLTDDENVVPLADLSISDLLCKSQVASVQFDLESLLVEIEGDFLSVLQELLTDWDYDCLSWGDPEGPLSSQMLNQDGRETFHRSKDSSVNDNRSLVTSLHWVLVPDEFFLIEFILREMF